MVDTWIVDQKSWQIFEELSKLPFENRKLDLRIYGNDLSRGHIEYIAKAPNFSFIDEINVKGTSFSWNDLVLLWRSSMFGCRSYNQIYYESTLNKPIREIMIKIDDSELERQINEFIKNGKDITGLLAYRKEFAVTYYNGYYREFRKDAIKIFNIKLRGKLIDLEWINDRLKDNSQS